MEYVEETGTGGTLQATEVAGAALSMPGACPHCSAPHRAVFHPGGCPRVAAIEYYPTGAIKRVELREID